MNLFLDLFATTLIIVFLFFSTFFIKKTDKNFSLLSLLGRSTLLYFFVLVRYLGRNNGLINNVFNRCALGLAPLAAAYFWKFIFQKYQLFDSPDGKLKIHQRPVPFSGGATIATLLLGVIFGSFVKPEFLTLNSVSLKSLDLLNLFFLPIFFVFPANFYDDLYRISPGKRFLIQLCFSIFAVGIFCPYNGLLSQSLSFVFVLSLLNAIDLVDVADGLCIGLSIVCLIGLCLIFPIVQLKLLCIILASILLGLFIFNSPEATIYLGNSGSGLIGAIFSVLILNYIDIANFRTFTTLTTIFGLFFVEVLALVLIRTYLGIRPYNGSPHHFNSFLRAPSGGSWSKWRVLSLVIPIAGLLNFIAWLIFNQAISFELYFSVIALALWVWMTVVYWQSRQNG